MAGLVCAVSFERYGRLYYFDPADVGPAVGDKVLVPTDTGPEVAECVWAPEWVSDDFGDLPRLLGKAGPDDLARDEKRRSLKARARSVAKQRIREAELPMKVVAVDYLENRSLPFTVYFTAPTRVDFRALLRQLAGDLGMRVELRQVGARDEAKLQGGIGSCGRDLCCATFLRSFEPVSVRMAKDQDLPLNPLKISGACGRLMCCLKYEHPLYQEFHAGLPKVGTVVETPQGEGRLVGYNVPAESVTVRLADGASCTCSKASMCVPRQSYERRDNRRDGARRTRRRSGPASSDGGSAEIGAPRPPGSNLAADS